MFRTIAFPLSRRLAVLSALADPNTARSSRAAAAGPATESSVTGVVTALEAAAPLPEHKDSALDEDSTAVDCSTVPPSITELRLEGVPLSESTVRAVRSAMPHLRSLKLYHYPMCYPHDHLPAASRTRTGQDELAKDAAAEDSGRRSVQGRGGSGGGGGGGSGVAAAVHALRSSLRSVRLHHCISIHGCTCGQQDADTIVSLDAPGGSARSGEQAAGSCVELEASEGSRSRVAAARCYGCRLGELVEALRSCRQLQHLGLRFTTTPSTTAQPSQEAMRAKEGSHHIHNRIVRERATAGPQPAILPLLLSQLTHLRSLKLQAQSQLPPELVLSAGLGDSLAHLPGLTRLVLGARLGLNSLAPLLLQPSTATAMSYLRDLDAPGCCVDSVGEVRALAGLSHLTRLSVGGFAHCLAAAFSSEGAAAVAASPGTRGGEGEGVTAVGGEGNVAAAVQAAPALSRLTLADKSGVPAVVLQQQQPLPLPLPPALCELSVASPLSPELLLLMHRPRCLATLRTTGFELGQQHVAAALPRAACLGLGDVGPQESEGRAFPGVALAVASTAAMEALAVAVRVLSGRDQLGTCGLSACSGSSSSSSTGGSLGAPGAHEEWGGRGAEGLAGAGVLFAYRDLGIELHVGYQGPPNALGGREYLAGCEVDRWGQAVGAGGEGAVKGGAGGGGEDGGGGAWPMGHGTWLVELRPLRLHGLQLEGLVLQEADVRCIAEGLEHLEVGVVGMVGREGARMGPGDRVGSTSPGRQRGTWCHAIPVECIAEGLEHLEVGVGGGEGAWEHGSRGYS